MLRYASSNVIRPISPIQLYIHEIRYECVPGTLYMTLSHTMAHIND